MQELRIVGHATRAGREAERHYASRTGLLSLEEDDCDSYWITAVEGFATGTPGRKQMLHGLCWPGPYANSAPPASRWLPWANCRAVAARNRGGAGALAFDQTGSQILKPSSSPLPRLKRQLQAALDDAVADSFPCSDPVSFLQPAPVKEGDRALSTVKANGQRATARD